MVATSCQDASEMGRPMRIAYVVHKFPPESLGGVEIYTWGLARTLARMGHHVAVFYPLANLDPAEACVESDGIRLWRAPLPAGRISEGPVHQYWHTFRDQAIEAAFQRFLAEVQPQVVHFQHVQGVSARLIALAAGRPRLATLHDYWFYCANSQLRRPDGRLCSGSGWGRDCLACHTLRADLRWLRRLGPLPALPIAYRNLYLRRMATQIDLFLSPSEFLRQQYIRQGFRAERIITMENGLDTERLTQPPEIELPPPPGRPHFGFLGALAWHKGVHVLVEAFNPLPESAALTIYGDEAASPEYVAQVKAAVRHPRVRFAGPADYRRVGLVLHQLDCLVVPSLWYENSPLVIQEAYGAGLPVVASRLGALAEKVRDGHTGRLFTAGDSADLTRVLRELVEEPQRLEEFRAQIRPAPTMEEHAQRLVALYRPLIMGIGEPRTCPSKRGG